MSKFSFEEFGLNARLLSPPKPMGRIHHHQEVEINYLFSGGVTYLHHWERRRLSLNRLTVFWGGTPHSLIQVEPGTEMAWITLPLPWLYQWGLPNTFVSGLMKGLWWIENRKLAEPERYPVRAWVRELASRSTTQYEALLLEIRACLLRMATGNALELRHAHGTDAAKPVAAFNHVETMSRYMAEHYTDDISVTDVAHAAGLHPKYAMPLFRRACGLTIRDYLAQYRLTHAQRQLITSDAKILDVALASGFRSQSAFYNSFTRATGWAPAEFRNQITRLWYPANARISV